MLILQQCCVECYLVKLMLMGSVFVGVMFDMLDEVLKNVQCIYDQVVCLKVMLIGNVMYMIDDEWIKFVVWFEGGVVK